MSGSPMSDKTMTADDAELIDAHANGANVWITRALGCRILATYAALAESQREVERLKCRHSDAWEEIAKLRAALAASQREVERLRAEQVTRAVDALPDGTTLIRTDKLDALRASLALAREEGARDALSVLVGRALQLSWGPYAVAEFIAKFREGHYPARSSDAAMSPPPETTQGESNG